MRRSMNLAAAFANMAARRRLRRRVFGLLVHICAIPRYAILKFGMVSEENLDAIDELFEHMDSDGSAKGWYRRIVLAGWERLGTQ